MQTSAPEPTATIPASDVDFTLERDDVDCSSEELDGGGVEFTTAHFVVDGILGAPCLGEQDQTVLDAWEALAIIAPPLARADLALFGGFVGGELADEVTLAFVNPVDDDGTVFQMSINLDSFDFDNDDSLLTVAHEFSHVFTLTPTQIDRTPEAEDSCQTFYNGEGCLQETSLLAQWIDEFWGEELLADFDPFEEPTVASGEPRCDLNPGFFGPYAASSPEEDFGESFSAFVFGLEVDHPLQEEKIDWMASQPGLAEFRDRAVAADLTSLENTFEECG
ncbi:MAG: hypothetical protein ACN4GZ_17195 [Acidimicrobiales bacterium]